jgi:hypothetical protein
MSDTRTAARSRPRTLEDTVRMVGAVMLDLPRFVTAPL